MGLIQQTLDALHRPWGIVIGTTSVLLAFVSLYQLWQVWGVLLVLVIFSIVCVISIVDLDRKNKRQIIDLERQNKRLSEDTSRTKLLEDTQEVINELVTRMRNTKKHLYYFGGCGFAKPDTVWWSELKKILTNKKVVRLIDLKKPSELKEYLGEHPLYVPGKLEDRIDEYRSWIRKHADFLNSEVYPDNSFYDFEGAPLWRYGVHCIIFDKKSIAFVSPPSGDKRRAVILDSPDIAEQFVDSIDGIVDAKYNFKSLTTDDLKRIAEM
jgi:hypothetical protein